MSKNTNECQSELEQEIQLKLGPREFAMLLARVTQEAEIIDKNISKDLGYNVCRRLILENHQNILEEHFNHFMEKDYLEWAVIRRLKLLKKCSGCR